MMKELESDEPFDVWVGCPTVTFELANESLMLPWSSFLSGHFKEGKIGLKFQKWQLNIEGARLGEVWELLQMQDLRALRRSVPDADRKACEIRSIRAEKESIE